MLLVHGVILFLLYVYPQKYFLGSIFGGTVYSKEILYEGAKYGDVMCHVTNCYNMIGLHYNMVL